MNSWYGSQETEHILYILPRHGTRRSPCNQVVDCELCISTLTVHNRIITLLFHKNCCPATCITAVVTPNRSLFGIPISTSLTTYVIGYKNPELNMCYFCSTLYSFMKMGRHRDGLTLPRALSPCFAVDKYMMGILIICIIRDQARRYMLTKCLLLGM